MRRLLGLGLMLLSCGGSGDEPELAADKEPCQTHSDCRSGYCFYNHCSPKTSLLEPCYEHEQCAAGRCERPFPQAEPRCTIDCGADEDCEAIGGVCAAWNCSPPCQRNTDVVHGACIDGHPVSCEERAAQEKDCIDCGCPDNRYCNLDGQCVDPLSLGKACSEHADCQSNNCDVSSSAKYAGSTTRVCLVGIGQSCTADNCAVCTEEGVFCSRRCHGQDECAPPSGSNYDTACVVSPSGSYCESRCIFDNDCKQWWENRKCVGFSNGDDGTCLE